MFEPDQFKINEVWIIFQLNEAPVRTKADGDFNALCLMDAASCYILGNELVSVQEDGVSEAVGARLIEAGRSQAHGLPRKCLVSSALKSDAVAGLASRLGLELSSVSDDELSPIVSGARESFHAYMRGGELH
jgi:hypothetical protein